MSQSVDVISIIKLVGLQFSGQFSVLICYKGRTIKHVGGPARELCISGLWPFQIVIFKYYSRP